MKSIVQLHTLRTNSSNSQLTVTRLSIVVLRQFEMTKAYSFAQKNKAMTSILVTMHESISSHLLMAYYSVCHVPFDENAKMNM